MKMLISLLLLVHAVFSAPAEKCFTGGVQFRIERSSIGGNEVCLKDDIAMYKIVVEYQKGDESHTKISAVMKAFVKETVQNWKECNPVISDNGNLNLITIENDFSISTKTYACAANCEVQVDKQHAKILLRSDSTNFYSIKGTLFKSGWFKNNHQIELENTCENVEIVCGSTLMRLHSCFKEHMPCIRFLHGKILTLDIATSICSNIELIITVSMILIFFAILALISKTYLCYLLIPIFIPISYVYSKIYEGCCKRCKVCGLAMHPLSSCPVVCVCGSKFENTNRLLLHRKSGLCTGFKVLRNTRFLCKSKGCNFLFAVFLSFLFLNFIAPINAACIDDSNLVETFRDALHVQSKWEFKELILIIMLGIFTILMISLLIILEKFYILFLRLIVIDCPECNMYHTKLGLRYNGDFTNKCGLCTCGELDDIEGLKIHKKRPNCAIKFKTYSYKMLIMMALIVLTSNIVIVKAEVSPLLAFKKCLNEEVLSVDCLPEFMTYPCQIHESVRNTIERFHLIGIAKTSLAIGEGDFDTISSIQANNIYSKKYKSYVNRVANCEHYDRLINGTNDWITTAKIITRELCTSNNITFCTCITGNCNTATQNFSEKLMGIEKTVILKLYQKIFNGISCDFISYLLDHNRDFVTKALLIKAHTIYAKNKPIQGLFRFIVDVADASEAVARAPTIPPVRYNGLSLKNYITHTKIKECSNPKLLNCTDKHESGRLYSYVTCSVGLKRGVYEYTRSVIKKVDSDTTGCLGDSMCHINFKPISEHQMILLKDLVCAESSLRITENFFLTECYPNKYGTCRISDNDIPVVQCTSNRIYKRNDPVIAGAYPGTINIPNGGSTPLEVAESQCTWLKETISQTNIRRQYHEDLQHFKEAILQKMHNDLVIHKFRPTANLPHLNPTFQSISVQGEESDNGVQNSYVVFDIPLISGSTVGLHLKHKGNLLYDFVVFVKSARLEGHYSPIYKTGPTLTINMKHEELCTGSCPQTIPKEPNWLSFTFERTNRWGCEEYGCLAINTGCLYGSCNDVIKPVGTVYRLQGEPALITEICITYPNEAVCQEMRGESLAISETIEIQLEKNEAFSMPDLIYYENNKIFKGDINPLGTYAKKCGNVQMVGNKTHGMGNPKIDYTCHLAKRKDVIGRRCFDNNYQSCKLLPDANFVYNHTDKELMVFDNTKNYGIGKVKLHLGDIEYKIYENKLDLSFNGHCFGCTNCFTNIDCTLEIHVDSITICSIEANCPLSTNRLLIKEDLQNYNVKAYCKSELKTLDFTICGKTVNIPVDLTLNNDKIELDIMDQTTYIREKDNRCGTWLCKVLDEGISINFLGGWGIYITVTIIIIIIILFILLLIYVIIPCCNNLKESLKHQDYMLLRELKQR
ncbi:polyprotein [Maprik virus]|uniref:Envelopment polyprotein n=1 Tax=Maprik virus TaxID=1590836 RepID=A0A0B4ZWW4_9VIRU|nr:polyprotein [Maprik virus]AJD77606.1 polyprotein [Maprik virus]